MTSESPGIRFPPPLVYLGFGLIGWTAERRLGLASPAILSWAGWTVAAGLAIVGIGLVVSAVTRFREAGTPPEPWKPTAAFTRKGIYGRTRNPMYLGMAAVLLALAAGLQSIGMVIALIPAILAIDRFVIRREEAYLLRRFGTEYTDYLAAVPRWL